MAWASAFVAAWCAFFIACPRLRRPLWWVSLCTAPMGMTEYEQVLWLFTFPVVEAPNAVVARRGHVNKGSTFSGSLRPDKSSNFKRSMEK
jgi:hypothetical protein